MSFLPRPAVIAAASCAVLLGATACAGGQDAVPEPTIDAAPAATRSAETSATTATSATTETTADAPKMLERSANEFEVPGAYHEMYAVALKEDDATCVYKPGNYFGCEVNFQGVLPPDEQPYEFTSGPVDYVGFLDDKFYTSVLVGGGDGPGVYHPLNPGEFVEIGNVTFTRNHDASVRVTTGSHWFEIDADGQYSSDSFDPAAGGASTQEVAAGPATCETFDYSGRLFVVEATDASLCAAGSQAAQGMTREPSSLPREYEIDGISFTCEDKGGERSVCTASTGGRVEAQPA
ncbi:hypothetical protein V6D40_04015 [Corynebacterium sp. Q4381]|uniref:hypothetical protein n=1 Tax=Corynebacterium sp. Marseille-Q4381 TaxID=3121597 RepID=UPI002FE61D35